MRPSCLAANSAAFISSSVFISSEWSESNNIREKLYCGANQGPCVVVVVVVVIVEVVVLVVVVEVVVVVVSGGSDSGGSGGGGSGGSGGGGLSE